MVSVGGYDEANGGRDVGREIGLMRVGGGLKMQDEGQEELTTWTMRYFVTVWFNRSRSSQFAVAFPVHLQLAQVQLQVRSLASGYLPRLGR